MNVGSGGRPRDEAPARAKSSHFRSDIEGLRALAVVSVVLFHMDLGWAKAGYLGVDIFYVISGFLITDLLLREQDQHGRIDVWEFYARRVRRILPALTVMVVVTAGLGAVLLSGGGEQQSLGKTALSTAGFVSNVYLWVQETGYFAQSAYTLPLLHTWTLAVEEQFYVVWPALVAALVWLARRFGRRSITVTEWGMAALVVATLVATFAVQRVRPEAVYYLTPFRMWELAAGGLTASLVQRRPPSAPWAIGLQLAGLLGVLAVFVQHRGQPVAGWATLVLVSGAAAILGAGAKAKAGPVYWLASLPPIRLLGRVSYGWYLWHWPLFSLGRILAGGQQSLTRDALLAVVALGAALASWALIEQPVRDRRVGPFGTRGGTLWAGVGLIGVCAAAGLSLWAWGNRPVPPQSLTAALRRVQDPEKVAWANCPRRVQIEAFTMQDCLLGDQTAGRSIVLFGDSHAAHLQPALVQLAKEQGFALAPRSFSACRPLLDPAATRWYAACRNANLKNIETLPALIGQTGAKGVILSAHWIVDANWASSLAAEVKAIRALGLKVALLADTPDFTQPVPVCVAHRPAAECARARSEVDAARRAQIEGLRAIAQADPGVRVFNMLDFICDRSTCPARTMDEILYHDLNHLSLAGSLTVKPGLSAATAWLLSDDPVRRAPSRAEP